MIAMVMVPAVGVILYQLHLHGGTKQNSGSITLSHIDRNTSIKNYFLLLKTINVVQLQWETADSIDAVQYRLNGGSWTGITGQQSIWNDYKAGWFYILNLTPNTTYQIQIRVRKAGSDSWVESGTLTVTTYDIARISSAQNFNHGDNAIVEITNPGSLTLTLTMKIGNTTILTKSANSGGNSISFTDAQLDTIYKLYGNGSSLTITFTVSGGGYTNNKTCIISLKGNQKTARYNSNGTWRRGKIWINVNGTWKRGVLWTKINGTWRRCI